MIDRFSKKRGEDGFTLIELLIVVIILGILAAVVIFGVSTFRTDSVSKACKTDKKQVITASAAYVAKYSTPASSSGVLVTDGELQSYPNSADYTIVYANTAANGQPFSVTVTGTGSVSNDCK